MLPAGGKTVGHGGSCETELFSAKHHQGNWGHLAHESSGAGRRWGRFEDAAAPPNGPGGDPETHRLSEAVRAGSSPAACAGLGVPSRELRTSLLVILVMSVPGWAEMQNGAGGDGESSSPGGPDCTGPGVEDPGRSEQSQLSLTM